MRIGRTVALACALCAALGVAPPARMPGARGTPAAAAVPAAVPAWLWIEGEDAPASTFNRHGWYANTDVRRNLLSPGSPAGPDARGDWLAHFANDGTPAEAEYRIGILVPGSYTFWIRASSYRVRQWYRLDGGPRQEMDLASDPRETVNLTAPKLDLRFLAWFRMADVDLAAGEHRLTIGVERHPAWPADNAPAHGGIDCICIVNFAWTPAGTMRPSLTPPPEPAPGDWFPLVVGDDAFSPDAITDVSYLLDPPAGRHGPLQRRGDALAFADGTAVKFWGIGAAMTATPDLQARQARFYAKHGINLVRQHPVESVLGTLQRDPASGERRLDPSALDRLDRWFATLKARGIYMQWSPFYPHVVTPDDGYPAELYAELPDQSGGKSSAGFVAFMPELQAAEWAWLSTLLDHVNPYTGLRYADDPALAILEVHNEDSVFWHFPLNDLAAGTKYPRHTATLKRLWRDWLRGRYADDAALRAAWGPPGAGSRADDGLDNPAMAIYGAWEMEADGPHFEKRERRRMGDFIRFLAETQRAYYAERGRQVRALGFRGVRVATAWQAGGPAAAAANLWTDDALDMIDRHAYFGGGEGNWRIVEGAVDNGSHLGDPGAGILHTGFEQVEDKPFMLSEWSQVPPNEWKAEIAPLVAFYGLGLGGWDASLHFAGSRPRMGSGWPDLGSFVSETPHYLGQFPALALAVRRGHIRAGTIAAARRIGTDDIFRGVDALSQDLPGVGYDPAAPMGNLRTPSEVFAMGRLTLRIGDDAGRSERADWDDLVDTATGVVTSVTGELAWDARGRVVVIGSPKTQGVVGFAGGRRFELPGAVVAVTTTFVSLLLTPLDDRPLVESGHILITAMARDRQTGARYSEDGTRLLDTGGPPLLMEPVRATITLGGAPVTSARAVDVYGVPTGTEIERRGNAVTIDGRYATYYYEVKRGVPPASPTGTATSSPTAGTPVVATPTPTGTTPTPAGPTVTATPGAPIPARRPLYLPALVSPGRAAD
jgi:hypothetical protein